MVSREKVTITPADVGQISAADLQPGQITREQSGAIGDAQDANLLALADKLEATGADAQSIDTVR
jgi:hypothetical protein